MECASFTEARQAALQAAHEAGYRVLIYAVTTSGRSALIPQDDWDRYAALAPRQAAE
jgi:hypothetical protein